ncbi:MAG TPA: hypothetical protein VNJ10_09805 [Sphingomonas sp.]|nr:hypothetical protein [Sphingomonas sp.]
MPAMPRPTKPLVLRGGKTARNRMVVAKFGLPVASLDEAIERIAS